MGYYQRVPDAKSLQRELDRLEAELIRRDFKLFIPKVWKFVEPQKPYVGNWHIDELAEVLMALSRGELRRVLINVPPGTMKTLLTSVFWPCWEWTRDPTLRYLTASYSMARSMKANYDSRQIMDSEWYKRLFPEVVLQGDAKGKLATSRGGWRIATSVGGQGTGIHPDRNIIDDPTTAKQAQSKVERTRANEWNDLTIGSRGMTRDVRNVVIMQRLHEDDLAGHLLQKGGWEHICLPMEYDPSMPDKRDPRTEPNELLWPALYTPERVKELKNVLGEYGVAGQLQQRPAPQGGGLFKRFWFEIVEPNAVPTGGVDCRAWDTASTEDGGDWTVGVRMKWVNGQFFIISVVRGQWSPNTVEHAIRQTAHLDGRACRVREEKEPGSAGATVISKRVRDLAGFDYRGVHISGDKVTRANPLRAQAEAGNVKIVRGEWNEAFLQELAIFPNGKNDDQVDASSCAFNELTTGPRPMRVVDAAWG